MGTAKAVPATGTAVSVLPRCLHLRASVDGAVAALKRCIAASHQPGTTLLVTRGSLATCGTGKQMTTLANDKKWRSMDQN
jgi:hypothetical protein